MHIKREYKEPVVNPLVGAEFVSSGGAQCRISVDEPLLCLQIGVSAASFDKSDLKGLISLLQEFHDQMTGSVEGEFELVHGGVFLDKEVGGAKLDGYYAHVYKARSRGGLTGSLIFVPDFIYPLTWAGDLQKTLVNKNTLLAIPNREERGAISQ